MEVIDLTEQKRSQGTQIAQTWPFNCVRRVGKVVTIPAPMHFAGQSPLEELARLLMIGRQYHPLCREAFVVKMVKGYYYYERHDEWQTCAVAAAYAGLHGPSEVERESFSWSQAIWELDRHVGFKLSELWVVGPTGRKSTVYDEMVLLTDTNFWTRRGIAHWLPSADVLLGVNHG